MAWTDSHKISPDQGVGYTPAGMRGGPSLHLGKRACGQDLSGSFNPIQGTGELAAGRTIRERKAFGGRMSGDAAYAMGQLFGPIDYQALSAKADFSESPAMAWFDPHRIPVPWSGGGKALAPITLGEPVHLICRAGTCLLEIDS